MKLLAPTVMLVVLAGVFVPIQAKAAGNLLINSDFDADLTGWDNPLARPAQWQPVDAGGDPASGSAHLINDTPVGNDGTLLILSQCMPATAGHVYAFGADLQLPPGQPEFTTAGVFLISYSSGDCSLGELNFQGATLSATSGWQSVSGELATSPDTQSLILTLGVSKPGSVTVETKAYFDRVYLVDLDDDVVFANGFESE